MYMIASINNELKNLHSEYKKMKNLRENIINEIKNLSEYRKEKKNLQSEY